MSTIFDKDPSKKSRTRLTRAGVVLAGMSLSIAGLTACGPEEPAQPNTQPTPVATASYDPSPEASASALPTDSALASSSAESQTLDTNYDEAEIIKQINIMRSQAIPESVAALEIAKNPELAIQLGANELWWKAEINIANAYIAADDAVRNLPGDPDSHGFNFGMGFMSKAMLPLYATGLQIAQENNIPIYPDGAVSKVIVNGQEVSLGNLGLELDLISPTQAKETGLCANIVSPIDESLYTTSEPLYEGKDEPTIEIIKQLDLKRKQIVIDYLNAIDAPCK